MRAEGVFFSLEFLYGGLGIGKLQFLILKNVIFSSAVNFFKFLVIKTMDPEWIRIGIKPKMLAPDPNPYHMNTNPKHCLKGV